MAVGTGFATSFYLLEYLRWAPATARVLVLERGPHLTHAQRLLRKGGRTRMVRGALPEDPDSVMRNVTPARPWYFGFGHGGGSNCWWGTTPRMTPADFETGTRFGVGVDWPFGYDDLEEAYCDVEDVMGIAGSTRYTWFPRSRPYPLPPHRMNDPDYALAARFPDAFFPVPTARASRPFGTRPGCCATHRCNQCPNDAKFTVLNGMGSVYEDPRVETLYDALALAVEVEGGRATGLRYRHGGREVVAKGDLVVLGANAIFNPHLLLRSGLDDGVVGRGIVEQVGRAAFVRLRGMKGFQASTVHSGHGYLLHGDEKRRDQAACLIETSGAPLVRMERGRWLEHHVLHFVYEDLPQADNRVTIDRDDPERPRVEFQRVTDYTQRAIDRLEQDIQPILDALPTESYELDSRDRSYTSQYHIHCTCPMGTDPDTSVVDDRLMHHRVRDLVVAGASAFPTCPPANPTLTLSAVALRAARRTFQPEAAA